MIPDIPCSCNGNNENCYKCSGVGFYTRCGDEIPPSDGVLVHHKEPAKPKGNSKSSNRIILIRDVSPSVSTTPRIASAYPTTTRNIAKAACPECGKLCKGTLGVRDHARAAHHIRFQIDAPVITYQRAKHVNAQRAQKRPSPAALMPRSTAPIKSKGNSSSTYYQIPDTVKPQRESKFDGSRDYYSNYREGGMLGSHASHDAYGDEDFA